MRSIEDIPAIFVTGNTDGSSMIIDLEKSFVEINSDAFVKSRGMAK